MRGISKSEVSPLCRVSTSRSRPSASGRWPRPTRTCGWTRRSSGPRARRGAPEGAGDRLRRAPDRGPRGDRPRCRRGRDRGVLARVPVLAQSARAARRAARASQTATRACAARSPRCSGAAGSAAPCTSSETCSATASARPADDRHRDPPGLPSPTEARRRASGSAKSSRASRPRAEGRQAARRRRRGPARVLRVPARALAQAAIHG